MKSYPEIKKSILSLEDKEVSLEEFRNFMKSYNSKNPHYTIRGNEITFKNYGSLNITLGKKIEDKHYISSIEIPSRKGGKLESNISAPINLEGIKIFIESLEKNEENVLNQRKKEVIKRRFKTKYVLAKVENLLKEHKLSFNVFCGDYSLYIIYTEKETGEKLVTDLISLEKIIEEEDYETLLNFFKRTKDEKYLFRWKD